MAPARGAAAPIGFRFPTDNSCGEWDLESCAEKDKTVGQVQGVPWRQSMACRRACAVGHIWASPLAAIVREVFLKRESLKNALRRRHERLKEGQVS